MRLSGRTYQKRVASCAALSLDVLFPRDSPPNSSWRGRYAAAKRASLFPSVSITLATSAAGGERALAPLQSKLES